MANNRNRNNNRNDQEQRGSIEQQKPHTVIVKTVGGAKHEHKNSYHGFDGDDLIVIAATTAWSYIYPKGNIIQIAIADPAEEKKEEETNE
jgi:hypothetical protein